MEYIVEEPFWMMEGPCLLTAPLGLIRSVAWACLNTLYTALGIKQVSSWL